MIRKTKPNDSAWQQGHNFGWNKCIQEVVIPIKKTYKNTYKKMVKNVVEKLDSGESIEPGCIIHSDLKNFLNT